MKKPSIDLSKEGMKSFLLHHVEKLILGVAFLLLGFLIWNGWSTEKYVKSDPIKLSNAAKSAAAHISSNNAWDRIAEFRKGDDKADDRIKFTNNNQLDSSLYGVRRILGTPIATAGLRTDPELVSAIDLQAKPFVSTVMINTKYNTSYVSPVSGLAVAGAGGGDDRGGGAGRGGGGARGGADAGGGRGDGGRGGGRGDDDDPENGVAGDAITEVMLKEMVGFRPNGSGHPFVLDGVAVTGAVNFGEQFKNYENAFRNAMAYYPKRDRPVYLYLEVQRREFKANPENQEDYDNAWLDISEQFFDDIYAGNGAPEVVDPAYFDKTLTRSIPPLVNLDYRGLTIHPLVKMRALVPGGMDDRNSDDPSVAAANDPDPLNRGVQFPGVDEEGEGESDDLKESSVADMMGNNRAVYEKLNPLSRPKADYKLVRFFDYRTSPGKSYQYRVRLWLNDPNDLREIDEEDAEGGGSGGRPAGPTGGRDDRGGGGGRGGQGARGSTGDDDTPTAGTEVEEDEELTNAVFKALSVDLQEPSVRSRVRGKNVDLPPFRFSPLAKKTRLNEEVVNAEAERRKQYKKEMTKILSNAWATDWSDPTDAVTVGGAPADYFAGKTIRPSVQRFDGFDVPRSEPSAKLLTSFWSSSVYKAKDEKAYQTAIPSLRTVFRSDVLNYNVTKAHVLDPISTSVKEIEKTKINTNAVVLDMMGGEECSDKVFKLPVDLDSEILVMDSSGKFHVRNSRDDLLGYRHSLFLPDESNEYGRRRGGTAKKDENDRGGGAGRGRGNTVDDIPDFGGR